MSALALLLNDLKYEVIGSDSDEYYFTEDKLHQQHIQILSFNQLNITNDYFYIIGNAYDQNNEEVKKIIELNYSYLYYQDFINQFLNKKMIACSGTHGKTTVATFITQMLDEKCNYIIGDGSGGGYNNNILVLEACEYKRHFINYHPYLLLINNIELDHTDYYKNNKDLVKAFQTIAEKSSIILVNGDDKKIKKIKHPKKITYGFSKKNDAKIKILSETKTCYYIKLTYKQNYYLKVPYLGRHMIYNYVASFMACIVCGLIPNLKKDLVLPKRRLEITKYKESILISDYAHHPTEINALYNTLKKMYKDKKLNVIFQPHTYERTIRFKKQFKKILKKFDKVYLMDIFTSKREKSSILKQQKINRYFKRFMRYNDHVLKLIKDDEVWVFLGAGNSAELIKKLKY